jgi:Zn-dependent protease with chaperone function
MIGKISKESQGGAGLAGTQKMIGALKISGRQGGFRSLRPTHPPLEERIRRLREFG